MSGRTGVRRGRGMHKDRIRKEYGKPTAQVLVELLQEGQTVPSIAKTLDVSKQTVHYWIRIDGINYMPSTEKTVAVKRGDKIIIERQEGGREEYDW